MTAYSHISELFIDGDDVELPDMITRGSVPPVDRTRTSNEESEEADRLADMFRRRAREDRMREENQAAAQADHPLQNVVQGMLNADKYYWVVRLNVMVFFSFFDTF